MNYGTTIDDNEVRRKIDDALIPITDSQFSRLSVLACYRGSFYSGSLSYDPKKKKQDNFLLALTNPAYGNKKKQIIFLTQNEVTKKLIRTIEPRDIVCKPVLQFPVCFQNEVGNFTPGICRDVKGEKVDIEAFEGLEMVTKSLEEIRFLPSEYKHTHPDSITMNENKSENSQTDLKAEDLHDLVPMDEGRGLIVWTWGTEWFKLSYGQVYNMAIQEESKETISAGSVVSFVPKKESESDQPTFGKITMMWKHTDTDKNCVSLRLLFPFKMIKKKIKNKEEFDLVNVPPMQLNKYFEKGLFESHKEQEVPLENITGKLDFVTLDKNELRPEKLDQNRYFHAGLYMFEMKMIVIDENLLRTTNQPK